MSTDDTREVEVFRSTLASEAEKIASVLGEADIPCTSKCVDTHRDQGEDSRKGVAELHLVLTPTASAEKARECLDRYFEKRTIQAKAAAMHLFSDTSFEKKKRTPGKMLVLGLILVTMVTTMLLILLRMLLSSMTQT